MIDGLIDKRKNILIIPNNRDTIKFKKEDFKSMEKQDKAITLRMSNELHKLIKKTAIDEEKTMSQYFIDLAVKDLEKKGIEVCQEK